ncbi:acyl-CoA esterase [bacterium BMS3Bbin10]|nr:acyl-CoA esterase [bacterium BMS3Bbin10]
MSKMTQDPGWIENTYSSHDGLKLYSRHYPARQAETAQATRPVLCLPGLTRNSNDFHVLALHLSQNSETPRDVYCLDYRGRGRSGYDPSWRNYSPYIELLDTLDFMTLTTLHHAAILGTSRGGIIAMLMAVIRPGAIGAVILNDIGPVIEMRGLARIIGYVGKTPAPDNWEEAALIVRDMSARFFTDISDTEWMELARQLYMEEDGLPVPGYDPALANSLSEIDLASPTPRMWPHFDALRRVPVLVLRGENTDVLSQETVDEMAARHPGLQTYEVQEEGHAPLLRDRYSLRVIDRFLAGAD